MRSDTKAELQMLREYFWLTAPEDTCYFCRQPLVTRPLDMTFGHRRHSPVDVKISIHHLDKDRENNKVSNLHPAHKRCHESHHAKERADAKRRNSTTDSGALSQSAG